MCGWYPLNFNSAAMAAAAGATPARTESEGILPQSVVACKSMLLVQRSAPDAKLHPVSARIVQAMLTHHNATVQLACGVTEIASRFCYNSLDAEFIILDRLLEYVLKLARTRAPAPPHSMRAVLVNLTAFGYDKSMWRKVRTFLHAAHAQGMLVLCVCPAYALYEEFDAVEFDAVVFVDDRSCLTAAYKAKYGIETMTDWDSDAVVHLRATRPESLVSLSWTKITAIAEAEATIGLNAPAEAATT
jgi:hypothetical protein